MKIENATDSHLRDISIPFSADGTHLEDVAMIADLIQRTILPRLFYIKKDERTYALIIQNRQVVGYSRGVDVKEGFIFTTSMDDLAAHYAAVKQLVNSIGALGSDDLLSIRRIPETIMPQVPSSGVDIARIDFSAEIKNDVFDPDGKVHNLRVVVDNHAESTTDTPHAPSNTVETDSNLAASSANALSEAGVTTEPEAVVPQTPKPTPVVEEDVSDIAIAFYNKMVEHSNAVVLLDRAGAALKHNGVWPEVSDSFYTQLIQSYDTWDSAGFATPGPKVAIHLARSSRKSAFVYTVSEDKLVVAEVEVAKFSRVLMVWNMLLSKMGGK